MGAFVLDEAMVATTVNPIPPGSSVTFNLFPNAACSGLPSSSETVAVPAGGMAQSAESSGITGVTANGPLAVGAMAYNAVFNSGDTGQVPNSAPSACEPLRVGSSISQFFYNLDGNSPPSYNCTFESLVNNTCPGTQEAAVKVGTTHSYQVNVQVTNNTGLPITEKVQGGLTAVKGITYSNPTVTSGCGAAALRGQDDNVNVVVWNATGSSASKTPGFSMTPGQVCNLEVTVTEAFKSTGQQIITGQWSESQTETSPVDGGTITLTSPYTGSLVVRVTN